MVFSFAVVVTDTDLFDVKEPVKECYRRGGVADSILGLTCQALTKARLQECEKGTPSPEAVVLVKLHFLPGRCIPININVDVLIPSLRFPFEKGND